VFKPNSITPVTVDMEYGYLIPEDEKLPLDRDPPYSISTLILGLVYRSLEEMNTISTI